jgi:hypothetical protein
MRAGVEPERIVAGVLVLLVAAYAAAYGSVAIGLTFLALGWDEPRTLLGGTAAVGFAAALTWLSVVVLAGRHSRRALALATVLIAAAIAGLGGAQEWVTILLLGIAITNIVALLIGTYRLAQR